MRDEPPRPAFFHNDDYCQVQLLPAAIERFLRAELDRLADFLAQHQLPDGSFDDIYMRPPPPQSLRLFDMTDADVSLAIWPTLKRYDQVYTNTPEGRALCPGVHAWGDDDFSLFAVVDDTPQVTALFLPRTWSAEGAGLAAQALPEIPHAHDMLLVDWDRLQLVEPCNPHMLEHYLNSACD